MWKSRPVCLSIFGVVLVLLAAGGVDPVAAHHVLGRPSYGLDEHSNTPPGEQLELTSGRYLATFMAFPAFPQPGQPARVNLYLATSDGGGSHVRQVSFSIRKRGWFPGEEDPLGVQLEDDKVFRQGFTVSEPGDYVIIARFQSSGADHVLEFPLSIGDAGSSALLTVGAGVLLFVLVVLTLIYRRRLTRAKIRTVRDETTGQSASDSENRAFRSGH